VLTDIAIRKSQPRESQYKLSDAQGLYLLVRPNGAKLWRLKYRFGGKEKTLSFGSYPEVSLLNARKAKEVAREELQNGQDPPITASAETGRGSKNRQSVQDCGNGVDFGPWEAVDAAASL